MSGAYKIYKLKRDWVGVIELSSGHLEFLDIESIDSGFNFDDSEDDELIVETLRKDSYFEGNGKFRMMPPKYFRHSMVDELNRMHSDWLAEEALLRGGNDE